VLAMLAMHPEDDAADLQLLSLSALIKASCNNKCSFIGVNQPRQSLNSLGSQIKYRGACLTRTTCASFSGKNKTINTFIISSIYAFMFL